MLKKRINVNVDEAFRTACKENSIDLSSDRMNKSSVDYVDDKGNKVILEKQKRSDFLNGHNVGIIECQGDEFAVSCLNHGEVARVKLSNTSASWNAPKYLTDSYALRRKKNVIKSFNSKYQSKKSVKEYS